VKRTFHFFVCGYSLAPDLHRPIRASGSEMWHVIMKGSVIYIGGLLWTCKVLWVNYKERKESPVREENERVDGGLQWLCKQWRLHTNRPINMNKKSLPVVTRSMNWSTRLSGRRSNRCHCKIDRCSQFLPSPSPSPSQMKHSAPKNPKVSTWGEVALSSNPRSLHFWGSGKDFPPAWELEVVFTADFLAPGAL
jgi:hypothetical protein